ncbi:hypothetical protein LshimejAT787_0201200 [Lyophyllum shimeji]|uniref:Uncharacterized protein n=1 Tax=Lyophyllum shimeji TaxID=47721 RepID=A0A9P3UKJ7_LYOSH|nr:hypothetical protein LshimejAT787_0201200 [Lyophyllum shimeji]
MPRTLSIDGDLFDMPPRPTSPISFSRHPTPSSRAADINRLLDPSYSSNAYASTSAYVDRHGELHDPDYRQFPIAQPLTSKRHSSHSHAYAMATRPRWELADEDAVDDEDADEDFSRSSIIGRHHSRGTHSNSFSSYHQQRPFATYTYYPTPTYSHINKHHTYSNHHHHVPQSFDSDETVLDEDDEDDAFGDRDSSSKAHNGVSRMLLRTKREFTRKRRSLDGASRKSIDSSSPYSHTLVDTPASATTAVDLEPDDAASLHAPSHHHHHHHALTYTVSHQSCSRRSQHSRVSFHSEPHHPLTSHTHTGAVSADSHHDSHSTPHAQHDSAYRRVQEESEPVWTPTCMQALRRQWQAVTLRIRFGVFRAQRRLKSRLAMK